MSDPYRSSCTVCSSKQKEIEDLKKIYQEVVDLNAAKRKNLNWLRNIGFLYLTLAAVLLCTGPALMYWAWIDLSGPKCVITMMTTGVFGGGFLIGFGAAAFEYLDNWYKKK